MKFSLFILCLIFVFHFSFSQQTELLTNPNFDDGTNGWWAYGADITTSNGEANFDIGNAGSNPWDIQLGQGNLTLKKDHKYTLCWRAKRESGSINLSIALGEAPWTTFISDTPDNFDGSWQENCIVYIHLDEDISNIPLTINMGGSEANASFDYISLKEEIIEEEIVEPIAYFIKKSFSNPGNMELKNVPQFVCLSFDDNVYADGVEWLCTQMDGVKNPNGNDAGLSFYFTSWQFANNNNLAQVVNKYLANPSSPHEMGNHTYHHPHLEEGRTVNEWKNIIQQGMDTLMHYTSISLNDLRQSGFRAPFVETNEELFSALDEMGIRYDHSTGSYLNDDNESGWPFMYETNSGNQSNSSFWKVPVSKLHIPEDSKVLLDYGIDLDIASQVGSNMTGAGDYHFFEVYKLKSSSILGLLKYNLDLSLQSNKAPFTFCLHSHYYSAVHALEVDKNSNTTLAQRQEILSEFISYCQQKEDVYLTSVQRMLDWMETPIDPEISLVNPGIGPVSYYGKMQVSGNKVIGNRIQHPMQVKGMSFFWSMWGGEEYWNADAVNALVDDWKVEIVRAPMGVESTNWSPDQEITGYIYEEGEKAQIELMETMVEAAIEKDIYVIIDFHSHEAHLHTEKAKEFFSYMAEKYGQYDNVIFEIYNEPAGPSYDERYTWSDIKAYAEEVIKVIRVHSENLIVVAPPWYATEIDKVVLDPLSDTNTCYTLHFYAATAGEDIINDYQNAVDEGLAIFATEWGTVNYLGEGEVDYESSNAWMDFMDTQKISSTNWSVNDMGEGASIFNPGISRTGGGWRNTLNMSPSGLYVYKMLAEHAQTAPWRKVTKEVDLEILATNPGAGPVSFYGEMLTHGNRIHGERTNAPVQVKGLSLFWSIWNGEKFWNSGAINSLVDNWDMEIIRAPMSVEGNNGWDFGYLNPNGKDKQIWLMEQVVEAAIARDIYVIIDYHAHEAHLNTEAAIEFFANMAQKYGQYDNVIFEIYNEPRDADWPTIKVYAERVIDEIRKHSDNLIVVGTPEYSQKVNEASLDPIDDPNTAYVFHFYANHLDDIRDIIRTALDNGIPLFATEWGNIYAYGDKQDRTDKQAFENSDVWHQMLDKYSISSAHWSVYVTDMTGEQPNEAAIFNSTFDKISTTGAGLGDTTLFTPSGLYTYKLLKEQAQIASWRKAEKQGYSINYHLNGGYNGANPVFYPFNLDKEIVLKDAIKEGYEFKGWYSNAAFTGDVSSKVSPGSTGEINLYAKWIVPDSLELLSYPNLDFVTYGWNDQWREDSVSFNNGIITIHELTDNSEQLWKFVIQNNARFSLTQGKRYTLRWKAKRNNGEVQIEVKQPDPFKTFLVDKKTFNGEWQENELIYDHTTSTVDGIELAVLIGGYTSDVSFDYISLKESDIEESEKVEVTFQVDMQNETVSSSGVFLRGDFNGWDSNDALQNDGSVYYTTAAFEPGTEVQYKFVNGDQWEDPTPGSCTKTSDYTNRYLVIPEEDIVLDAVCFKSCEVCDPVVGTTVDITFRVDMQNEDISSDGVYLKVFENGDLLNDPFKMEADKNVYTATVGIVPGLELEYSYVNGDPNNTENFENFSGDCSSNGRREMVVPDNDLLLDLVCFGTCDACIPNSVELFGREILYYPNPVDNRLYIFGLDGLSQGQVKLVDALGRVLITKELTNQNEIQINMQNLKSGQYYIQIDSEKGQVSAPVLKK